VLRQKFQWKRSFYLYQTTITDDAAISFVEEFIESYVVSENKEEKETKTIGDATFYGKKANKQYSHLSLSIYNSKAKLS